MAPLAPIALFAYNRPEHLRRTLEALHDNPLAGESHLIVFSDGPRSPADEAAVAAVRAAVTEQPWCRIVELRTTSANHGLAESIMRGVEQVITLTGRVVVLEDDLLVSRHFLSYMNEALDRYENATPVMQVSGHCFPALGFENSAGSSFLPFTTSWGWATWARAWKAFDRDMAGIETIWKDRQLRNAFDIDGSYPYSRLVKRLLRRNQLDRSWAIRWHWAVFRRKGIVLYPYRSLVLHRDVVSGTNVRHRGTPDVGSFASDNRVTQWPAATVVDQEFYAQVKRYLRHDRSWMARGRRLLRRMLPA